MATTTEGVYPWDALRAPLSQTKGWSKSHEWDDKQKPKQASQQTQEKASDRIPHHFLIKKEKT